eukprot:COSAG02_NODE_4592_length_5182_cov_4.487901_4_plen_222_part_00
MLAEDGRRTSDRVRAQSFCDRSIANLALGRCFGFFAADAMHSCRRPASSPPSPTQRWCVRLSTIQYASSPLGQVLDCKGRHPVQTIRSHPSARTYRGAARRAARRRRARRIDACVHVCARERGRARARSRTRARAPRAREQSSISRIYRYGTNARYGTAVRITNCELRIANCELRIAKFTGMPRSVPGTTPYICMPGVTRGLNRLPCSVARLWPRLPRITH